MAGTVSGVITEIGHGTMRDGPGWRSIVYFKGCNFRCLWCGSPDTMSTDPEILYYPERVKQLARAVASCPSGALRAIGSDLQLERGTCRTCEDHHCVKTCLDGSVELSGRTVSVQEILDEILPYLRAHNQYGVTLSGGEATLQWDFYRALLQACRVHGLHTAVETNGSSPKLPESFPLLDLVICDLKHMDDREHRTLTGHGNATILNNIQAAAASSTELRIRIPLVPGINDGDNIKQCIQFLLPMKERLQVEILGYHRLGTYKWKALGRAYALAHVAPPDADAIRNVQNKIKRAGLTVISS